VSPQTLQHLLPEIVLVAVAVSIYVAGAFVDARREWSWIAGAGVLLAACALAMPGGSGSGGLLIGDALARYARWVALAFGGLLVLLAARPLRENTSEYAGSLLLTIAGLMLVASAGGLVLLFVGLELVSIPTYILLYLGRRGSHGGEATAKYFFLGILASAMLVYGFALLYGTAGSTDLSAIRAAFCRPGSPAAAFAPLSKVATVLILAGLGFKIAAVPFHFYAPDVYQGTSHANAALLSVIPKAAGFVALLRVVVASMPPMPGVEPYVWRVVVVLAVLTMCVGNVLALWQENLRRLLAYSSIAHAGYMLIGLAVALVQGHADGAGALLFYFCVYAAATVGTFAALDYLGRDDRQLDAVEELAGLGRTRPLAAAALAVFLFSLTGIPPLAGFWGKLAVFASALNVDPAAETSGSLGVWYVVLAVIGVLNAVVAAAYYLRIVAVMYFRTPLAVPKARGGPGSACAVVFCVLLVIAIGLFPGPLMQQSDEAGRAVVVSGEELSRNKLAVLAYMKERIRIECTATWPGHVTRILSFMEVPLIEATANQRHGEMDCSNSQLLQ